MNIFQKIFRGNKLTSDVFVELHVPDFDKTVQFYSQLGFEVMWRRNEATGYLVMQRGKSIINFYAGTDAVYNQSYFRKFPKDTIRGYAVEIVILVDQIKNLYDVVKKKFPNNIVEELKMQSWGRKDFRMTDPFGFYLRFTERYDWVHKYPKGSIFIPKK
jgi:predicted lactoylglutathione lyase